MVFTSKRCMAEHFFFGRFWSPQLGFGTFIWSMFVLSKNLHMVHMQYQKCEIWFNARSKLYKSWTCIVELLKGGNWGPLRIPISTWVKVGFRRFERMQFSQPAVLYPGPLYCCVFSLKFLPQKRGGISALLFFSLKMTRWWFQRFVIFTLPGEMIHFD